MYPLPIEPYLIELLVATHAQSCPVVVAGGLGIYLKHRQVRQQLELLGRRSLLDPLPLPDARATADIDAFLSIDIFLREPESGVRRFRGVLDSLAYQAYERARYFQFIKPMADASERMVKIDLHVRSPRESDLPDLKVELDGVRLSRRGNAARRTVDAWNTPEAFAIDHGVQVLPLAGVDGDPRAVRPGGHPMSSPPMLLEPHDDDRLAAILAHRAAYSPASRGDFEAIEKAWGVLERIIGVPRRVWERDLLKRRRPPGSERE